MVDLLYHLTNLFFCDILLLLLLLLLLSIFCLNPGNMYFSLSISSFVSKLFCGEAFEALAIYQHLISFSIKSPVATTVFCMTLFEEVLNASVADCSTWSKIFWLYLLFKLWLIFLPMFLPTFVTRIHNL